MLSKRPAGSSLASTLHMWLHSPIFDPMVTGTAPCLILLPVRSTKNLSSPFSSSVLFFYSLHEWKFSEFSFQQNVKHTVIWLAVLHSSDFTLRLMIYVCTCKSRTAQSHEHVWKISKSLFLALNLTLSRTALAQEDNVDDFYLFFKIQFYASFN